MDIIWCKYCGRLIDIVSLDAEYTGKILDYCQYHKGSPETQYIIKKEKYSRFDYNWAKQELSKLSQIFLNKFKIDITINEIEFEKEILDHILKKEIRESGVLDHTISDHLRNYIFLARGIYPGKFGRNSFKRVAIKKCN